MRPLNETELNLVIKSIERWFAVSEWPEYIEVINGLFVDPDDSIQILERMGDQDGFRELVAKHGSPDAIVRTLDSSGAGLDFLIKDLEVWAPNDFAGTNGPVFYLYADDPKDQGKNWVDSLNLDNVEL